MDFVILRGTEFVSYREIVELTVRYGGLAIIAGPGGSKDRSLQRNSSFVSWENLSDR